MSAFLKMRAATASLLTKIYHHPFNQALYQGTLPPAVFNAFLSQDKLYLHDFSVALTLTSQRMKKDSHSQSFQWFASEILETEKKLLLKYSSSQGQELSKPVGKSHATQKYTSHLLALSTQAPIEVATAGFIPCFWLYNELGHTYFASAAKNQEHPYHLWLSSYANKQFTIATKSIIKIYEDLANEVTCENTQKDMLSAFTKSVEYEIHFWDSAYGSNQK